MKINSNSSTEVAEQTKATQSKVKSLINTGLKTSPKPFFKFSCIKQIINCQHLINQHVVRAKKKIEPQSNVKNFDILDS